LSPVVEYRELKNFGNLYTGKASSRVMMSAVTSVPAGLVFIGTPKFLAQLQAKDRHWRKAQFKALQKRGVTNQEVADAMRTNLAFYTALVAAQGREKAAQMYPKVTEKLGLMIYEDFAPKPEDFLRCPDVWRAVKGYFREFFQVTDREGVGHMEVMLDTDQEFQVRYTDCAWHAVACEVGYPEIMPFVAQADVLFLPRLMRALGGDFKRACWLCKGEGECDWHFYRHREDE
jgi:hypothetical protein